MSDGKGAKGASDREVRAHIRRVLKRLLPKGGEKRKGAGDREERLHLVARAGGVSGGRCADAGGHRNTCTDGATGVGCPVRAATIGSVKATDGD